MWCSVDSVTILLNLVPLACVCYSESVCWVSIETLCVFYFSPTTFAIVNFGQDPSYEVILGRPFIRQLMVPED